MSENVEKLVEKIFANARYAFRRDTLGNWESVNPTLLGGEIGVVTDGTETEKVKIGDGKTLWNQLPWWKGPQGEQGPQGIQGPKGDKGDKGEKGDTADLSSVAPAIKNTVSGGKSLTVNDVSPLAHKCSLKLTSEKSISDSKNIYKFTEENVKGMNFPSTMNLDVDEKGVIILNGYSENLPEMFEVILKDLIVGKTYTFSCKNSPTVNENYNLSYIYPCDADGNTIESAYGEITFGKISFTFKHTSAVSYYRITVNCGGPLDDPLENYKLYPQLELGDEATAWEQYIEGGQGITDFSTFELNVNGKSYTPNADGTVTNIESISPTMEITTDNEHVNICDFAYCVDTKKYVDDSIKAKPKYELINTITVAPDTDGSLPQYVNFTEDKDGNPFELTDFFINIGAGFTDGGTASIYMNVNGENSGIFSNANPSFTASTLRKTVLRFRQLPDGYIDINLNASTAATAGFYWNPQMSLVKQVLISPTDTKPYKTISSISLYTLLGTAKTWIEGSYFELWGIRK